VLKDGSRTFVAMGRAEVERIRDGSKGYQASKKYKKESRWDTDFVAMGLKTAIRRLCKYLPKSPELATALALDDQAGQQQLNVDDAINGTFSPVIDEETGEIEPATEKVDGASKTVTSLRPVPKQAVNKLAKVIAALNAIDTLEALDEVYLRAEGDLEGEDLEAVLQEYRKCKQALEDNDKLFD
jgi:recombination protein RecT